MSTSKETGELTANLERLVKAATRVVEAAVTKEQLQGPELVSVLDEVERSIKSCTNPQEVRKGIEGLVATAQRIDEKSPDLSKKLLEIAQRAAVREGSGGDHAKKPAAKDWQKSVGRKTR